MEKEIKRTNARKLEILSDFLFTFHNEPARNQITCAFEFVEDMLDRALVPSGIIEARSYTFLERIDIAQKCEILNQQQRDECRKLFMIEVLLRSRSHLNFESTTLQKYWNGLTLFQQYTAEMPDNRSKYLTSAHHIAMHLWHNYVH